MTAKEHVLGHYPKAYACYVGLSLKFVIVTDHGGAEISGYRSRVSDAWSSASKLIRSKSRTSSQG